MDWNSKVQCCQLDLFLYTIYVIRAVKVNMLMHSLLPYINKLIRFDFHSPVTSRVTFVHAFRKTFFADNSNPEECLIKLINIFCMIKKKINFNWSSCEMPPTSGTASVIEMLIWTPALNLYTCDITFIKCRRSWLIFKCLCFNEEYVQQLKSTAQCLYR